MDWTWGPADTWHATQRFLESVASSLPEKPKALLVISGHWEEPAFTAGAAAEPELIFDYSGFPAHTYQLTWPAPGDPQLAEQVIGLLRKSGLPAAASFNRGYDHGVFVPLKVAFPQADIPVVTLSLNQSLDPAQHIAAGRALAPLTRRRCSHHRQRHELPQSPRILPPGDAGACPRLRYMAYRRRRIARAGTQRSTSQLAAKPPSLITLIRAKSI